MLDALGPPRLSTSVRRDMKLHSLLLGRTGCLTKPCVSPQAFHGSTRLSGCGRVATIDRGAEPSPKCIKPGSGLPSPVLLPSLLHLSPLATENTGKTADGKKADDGWLRQRYRIGRECKKCGRAASQSGTGGGSASERVNCVHRQAR